MIVADRILCTSCDAGLGGPDAAGLARRRGWDWIDEVGVVACSCGRGLVRDCPCHYDFSHAGRCPKCRRDHRERFGPAAG